MEGEFDQFSGPFMMMPGYDGGNREMWLDEVDAGAHVISGQFVDQEGEGIPNATVEGLGVDFTTIDESVYEDPKERAEELLDEARSPLPDAWDSNYDLDSHMEADATYPLVHHKDDWGSGWTTIISDEVDDPRLTVDPDKEIVLSLWDPAEDGGYVDTSPVRSSHPGAPTEGTIVVEQLGPTGVLDRQELDTRVMFTEERIGWPDREWHAASTSLSPGIYRVYPEGAPERGYVISSGDPDEIASMFSSELENEAGELVETSQQIKDRLSSGQFERRTTRTNSTGHFEIRLSSNVERAAVQAYRADGQLLGEITGPSFEDLRTAVEEHDYNGTYVISSPQHYDVPTEGATIQGYRLDTLPNQPLQGFDEWRNWIEDQRLNETISELESEWDERVEEMERGQLETRYEMAKSLVETVDPVRESYLESSKFDEVQEVEDLSREELETETKLMEQAIFGANPLDFEPGDVSIGDIDLDDLSDEEIDTVIDKIGGDLTDEEREDLKERVDTLEELIDELEDIDDESDLEDQLSAIRGQFPLPEGVEEDAINVKIQWSDGTTEVVPEDFYEISGSGLFGARTLSVEYPIGPNDPATGNLVVTAANDEGIGNTGGSIINPGYSGAIPSVPAVDLSTTAPGPSDRVTVNLRPETGTGYDNLERVDVYDPDGNVVGVDIKSATRATFTTNGQGVHTVRMTYLANGGEKFVRTIRVRAHEQPRSGNPVVRASEDATGPYVIVGEGIRSGEIDVDAAGQVRIAAILPGGESAPSSIDLKPEAVLSGTHHDLSFRVLQGDNRETVRSHVTTYVHFDNLPEGSLFYHGDGPVTWSGDTRWGQVTTNDDGKAVLWTQTNDRGQLDLEIIEKPEWTDRIKHWGQVKLEGLPSLPSVPLWVDGLGLVFVGLIARRKRDPPRPTA
ncbi:hypothetical protein ACFQO4_20545 [Saliphagus sp. GCM10025334]